MSHNEAEPAKYTTTDKLFLKSLRHKVWPQSHPNVVWIKQKNKVLNLVTMSSIYGHFYWASVRKNGIDYLRQNYHTQPNDVFITSYPRSGTHFIMKICMEIMRNCAYNKNKLPPEYKNADYRFIPQFEPMVSKINGIEILNNFINRYNKQYETLRFQFTHCRWHLFPAKNIDSKTKIIHIVRNPKDTLASFFNLVRDLNKTFHPNIDDILKFDEIFDNFINGFVAGGNWWDLFIEWYFAAKTRNNNILFVYYEDILENPKKNIHKIAQFLLKDDGEKYLNEKLINDENILNHIVNQCTFSNQYKTAKRGWKDIIIRKGGIGDWKNYFTEKQEKLMDNITRIKFHGMMDIPYNTDKLRRRSML